MDRRICVHLGPHKTGSSAIQAFLTQNSKVLSDEYGVAVYVGADLSAITAAFQKTDWISAQREILSLRELILERPEKTIIISSEDLSGNLPGRSGTRRVYPRLAEHANLIKKAFPEFQCEFYFFYRQEVNWLKSVYSQNLRFRQNFGSMKKFDEFIRFDGGWASVTQKAIAKCGESFVLIPYEERENFCAEMEFLKFIDIDIDVNKFSRNSTRINTSPSEETLNVFEAINRSHASNQAKKDAKLWLLDPKFNSESMQKNTIKSAWPPSIDPATYPPALTSLADRAKMRVHTQLKQPWLLPEADVDLTEVRLKLVKGPNEFPGGNRQDMYEQEEILKYRFKGQPMINYFIAFCISYLRRDTPHTDVAKRLFRRAWCEEYPLLLATLPTRWLISSLQTFMDHGNSSDERMIGAAGYFFANTMKAYEAERALEGLEPNSKYPHIEPKTRNGFPGMDRFDLGGTDLMVNTLALLLEISGRDPISGRVLQELLVRTKKANTVFSRMDINKIHHSIHNPQFDNCWSFFEIPARK